MHYEQPTYFRQLEKVNTTTSNTSESLVLRIVGLIGDAPIMPLPQEGDKQDCESDQST